MSMRSIGQGLAGVVASVMEFFTGIFASVSRWLRGLSHDSGQQFAQNDSQRPYQQQPDPRYQSQDAGYYSPGPSPPIPEIHPRNKDGSPGF